MSQGDQLDFEAFIDEVAGELDERMQKNVAEWMGEYDSWDADGDEVTFKRDSDGGLAVCKCQIIGSLNSDKKTWLWAWANDSLPDDLKAHAEMTRAFGEEHALAYLVDEGFDDAEEADGWVMTAIAMRLADADGAYAAPIGDELLMFVTLGPPEFRNE